MCMLINNLTLNDHVKSSEDKILLLVKFFHPINFSQIMQPNTIHEALKLLQELTNGNI